MRHWIERAKQKAKQSSGRYKISAVGFDHKGNYLGISCNYKRFDRYGGGLHAEMNLLHRYGSKVKTMMICRVGATGDLLPIDPCERCQKVLDKLGIKVITIKDKK